MNYIPATQSLIMSLKQNYQAKKHVTVISPSLVEPSTSAVHQDDVAHPIMVPMPGVSNLVAYHAMNVSTMFDETNSSENTDVSNINASDFWSVVAVFIENVEGPRNMLTLSPKENGALVVSSLAPLIVPHLFWRASVLPKGLLPLSFDCLLDNGSHLVLICKSLVNQLGLCHQKLHLPIETELAM